MIEITSSFLYYINNYICIRKLLQIFDKWFLIIPTFFCN